MPDNRYLDEFPEPGGVDSQEEKKPGGPVLSGGDLNHNRLLSLWDGLSRAGLGETVFKFGTHLLSVALVLVVIWTMRSFYLKSQDEVRAPQQGQAALAASLPTAVPTATPPALPPFPQTFVAYEMGIPRRAFLDTVVPARPRTDVITYTVQAGDTVFGIAEQFNLKPETILWSNYDILMDNPHRLSPDQVLFILPVDGAYYKWSNGDGLNGVSEFYGVSPDDIVDYPGNHLTRESVGEYSNPNIEPGTRVIIPGGSREFYSWSAPRISRENPSVSKLLGPGACGTVMTGVMGSGTFIWPANERRLSGYDYSPQTNHRGIDIAGRLGDAIYSADNGVVVYAGWNNWGYGNVIVVDHGYGWQTLYAHLSSLNVGCGTSVFQGSLIGAFGSTGNSSGPHLHFEMLHESYGKVNPWDFLK